MPEPLNDWEQQSRVEREKQFGYRTDLRWETRWFATVEKYRSSSADDIRDKGWTVAGHNDYRLHGATYTFWLFTHPDGRWVKGEGKTDAEALNQVRAEIGGN